MKEAAGCAKTAPDALRKENRELKKINRRYIKYIRSKINQLLKVMGTLPLKPEELDDNTLLDIDPIGIIAGSFEQVLEHLRETNRELTIARDELQAIFDATGVGISIIDPDFRILKCNEKQRDLLVDRNAPDVTGKFCYEVYCDKDSPGLDCPAVDTLATGRSVIIREVEKKGKHFQIVTTPIKNNEGCVTGAIEVLLDITEKKRAEDAEKEQRGFYLTEKSKLATIIQSLSDGLFVTDEEGTILSFNDAARKITGYAEGEVVGSRVDNFFAMLSNCPVGIFEKTGNFRDTELTIQSRDGKQPVISIGSVLLKDSKGNDTGHVFTFRDITEEKQRHEIFHRTEKLVALGQLSAGIAHELNTPLGSILGYARLLMKDSSLDPVKRERLEIIAEQAKRGSAIIKELLNFARQSNPALRDTGDVNMNAIILDVVKILNTEAGKRNITISPELTGIPAVKADARQMEQVVLNIVLNAMQAIGKNGKISIKTFCEGDSLAVEIRDNGPGISQEIKSRIFDPFFTTKPVGEGTGLGLSICMGIVSEHNGSIYVKSAEGKGAAFHITLPLSGPDRIPA